MIGRILEQEDSPLGRDRPPPYQVDKRLSPRSRQADPRRIGMFGNRIHELDPIEFPLGLDAGQRPVQSIDSQPLLIDRYPHGPRPWVSTGPRKTK